ARPSEIFIQSGGFGGGVDQSCGRTLPEKNRVGTAGKVEALRVVSVEIKLGLEKVARALGAADAANTIVEVVAQMVVSGGIVFRCRVETVFDGLVHGRDSDVVEELLREDGNGRCGVPQLRIQ